MLVAMALSSSTRRSGLSTALAVALAAIVLLTLLGHNRLTDWDEGIYAGISATMARSSGLHAWLTPHWNGQPWLEKPPLMLWITAAFFRLFGISEFTARLGSALSGVALVGLLHGWLTVRRNPLTAWLSTIILLSTFGFQHVARVGEMDVLLSLACTLALIGLCELTRDNAHGWLLFWIGFALAAMTKGAAGLTLPITLALFTLTALSSRPKPSRSSRRRSGETRNSSLYCLLGLLLALALTLPWHLAMWHQFGATFTDQYLGLHVLTRATSQIEGHLTPWYFYLRVLLVSSAPWVLLYPFALWQAFRQRPGAPAHPLHPQTDLQPFALFSLTVLILFSIVQTRLPHYIAPLYPALSVLTAAWLAERLPTRTRVLQFAAAAIALYTIAALVTVTPRRALHASRLANGDATPDNREQIALLKQVFHHPSSVVATLPDPLLTLRTGTYNPIPTTVFYSGRTVQQVILSPQPPQTHLDPYTNDPISLAATLADHQPHLLLADRFLLNQLPPSTVFAPIAASPTLILGIATAPIPTTNH
jgi:4-amino-4-deoxy-L-arabinose transferase-like glycosyltransferase